MVRTCKHHVSYVAGKVQCSEFPEPKPVGECSGCPLFQLSFVRKQPVVKLEIPAVAENPSPCRFRGSQRRSDCCGGKLIGRWICRRLTNSEGVRMDCVETEKNWSIFRQMVDPEKLEEWDSKVAICEHCEHFEPRGPESD